MKTVHLRATLEGSDARILRLKGPGDDLMMLIVLDLIGDPASIQPTKDALLNEIRKLPSHTVVGLLRAQDGLKVLADPTKDREQVALAIESLPVSGKAGLVETVEAAGRIADSILAKTTVRVAILYVTDGDVTDYRADFTNPVINSSDSHDLSRRFPEGLIREKISNIDRMLVGQQTPLFVIHLHYRNDRINNAYQSGLKQLAETTAGTATFCRSSVEIPEAIEKAFSTIEAHYSVTLALPDEVGKSVQVGLEAERGVRMPNHRTHFFLRGK